MPSDCVVHLVGVDPIRIGGVEAHIHELSAQLYGRGWRSVLCFDKEPCAEVRDYLALPNVDFESCGSLSRPGSASIWRVSRVLWRYRPRILHLQFTPGLSAFPWLARFHGVEKVFFTDHSSWPGGLPPGRPRWKRMVSSAVTAPLTRVIVVSEYGQRSIAATGFVAPRRVARIYNGFDFRRLPDEPGIGQRFREKRGIPQDRAMVLQVSEVIPRKGIEDLLRAARKVIDVRPETQFVIVGDGFARPDCQLLADGLGIAPNVTWLGLITDPVAEGLYEAADIVCLMSHRESFGMVLMEAIASARPVVATRVGGVPEVVQDGQNGFLVELGDHQAMADRLVELLDDPMLRQTMGDYGYRYAAQHFDLQRNVGALVSLYGID